jgi:small subunit ribosomal protein S6
MSLYECVVILDPMLDDEAATKEFEEVKRRFTEEAACETVSESNWGRRKMAYQIRGKAEGNYFVLRFVQKDATVRLDLGEVQRYLRFAEAVMRHMIVLIPDTMREQAIPKPAEYASPATMHARTRSYGADSARRPPAPAASGDAKAEATPAEGAEAAEITEGAATTEATPAEAAEPTEADKATETPQASEAPAASAKVAAPAKEAAEEAPVADETPTPEPPADDEKAPE